MTLKEKIINILSEQDKPLNLSEIFDRYMILYPDSFVIKYDSYKGKKTYKEVENQIKAEIASTINRYGDLFITYKDPKPYRYKLKCIDTSDRPVVEPAPQNKFDKIDKNISSEEVIEGFKKQGLKFDVIKELYFVDDNYDIIKVEKVDGEVIFTKLNITSYTYVLSDYINGYKIGRTANNPESRLRPMKTGNPNLSIHFVLPFERMEKELHKRFEKYRNPGTEWFYPCTEIKEWVEFETNKILVLKSMYNKKKKIDELRKDIDLEFSKL